MTTLSLAFVLAQAADATEGMPGWLKAILGPLGLTIALGYYAYRTETVRLPKLVTLLEAAQAETKKGREECDDEKTKTRADYEAREKVFRRNLEKWRSRHSREKTRRIFWQTKAVDIAKKHGEEPPKMSSEIAATAFSHQPLPRDPEPDDSFVEEDLPPAPSL